MVTDARQADVSDRCEPVKSPLLGHRPAVLEARFEQRRGGAHLESGEQIRRCVAHGYRGDATGDRSGEGMSSMAFIKGTNKLQEVVDSHYWWHSIDLGNGIITPGKKTVEIMQLEFGNTFSKINVAGRTILDVGAWNGGFSVEAWRRGATSVTGLDHFTWNHPHYRGRETFNLISEATGANLKAIDRDLDDPRLDLNDIGKFDIVLFLGVFYHLQNPISALREVSNVAKDVLVLETYIERFSEDRPAMMFYPGAELAGDSTNWWGPNTACIVELLRLMEFARVEVARGFDKSREVFHAYRNV
jgi:tRNA (mo5U34)-methyltransferase